MWKVIFPHPVYATIRFDRYKRPRNLSEKWNFLPLTFQSLKLLNVKGESELNIIYNLPTQVIICLSHLPNSNFRSIQYTDHTSIPDNHDISNTRFEYLQWVVSDLQQLFIAKPLHFRLELWKLRKGEKTFTNPLCLKYVSRLTGYTGLWRHGKYRAYAFANKGCSNTVILLWLSYRVKCLVFCLVKIANSTQQVRRKRVQQVRRHPEAPIHGLSIVS